MSNFWGHDFKGLVKSNFFRIGLVLFVLVASYFTVVNFVGALYECDCSSDPTVCGDHCTPITDSCPECQEPDDDSCSGSPGSCYYSCQPANEQCWATCPNDQCGGDTYRDYDYDGQSFYGSYCSGGSCDWTQVLECDQYTEVVCNATTECQAGYVCGGSTIWCHYDLWKDPDGYEWDRGPIPLEPGMENWGFGCCDDYDNDCDGPTDGCDADGCCNNSVYDNQFDCENNGEFWYGPDSDCASVSCQAAVWVIANPPSVNTTWQNTDASASVGCSDFDGCDSNTYRLKNYTSDPGTCSTNQADYDISSIPWTVRNHSWFCATANDTLGNVVGFSFPMEFFVDQIPPTIYDNYTLDGEWTNIVPQIVGLFPNDTGDSGIRNVSICMGAGCTPNALSPYILPFWTSRDTIFRYQTWDNANSSSDIGQFWVRIDLTPPTSTIISPPEGSWHGLPDFDIDVSDTDAGSGVDYCEYRVISYPPEINGIPTTPWMPRTCDSIQTIEVNSTQGCVYEGVNKCQVDVRANDSAGNWGNIYSRLFSIDWTEPSTVLTSIPGDQINYNTPAYAGTATDTSSNVTEIKYRVSNETDGTIVIDWTNVDPFTPSQSVSFTFTATLFDDGTYLVEVRSIDEAGNVEGPPYANHTVTIDTIGPDTIATLLGTLGSNGWYISEVEVTLTCIDGGVLCSGNNYTQYCNTTGSSCTQNNRYQGPFNLTEDGMWLLNYSSVDDANNTGPDNQTTAKIDTTPPNSTILSPANESWFGSNFTVNVSDIDNTSGLSMCIGAIFNGVSPVSVSRTCDSLYTVSVGSGGFCSNEGVGNCTFGVYATDTAGTTGPADTRVYNIDLENATCTMNPLPGWSGVVFTINWSGFDALSGVQYYDVQLNDSSDGMGWRDIDAIIGGRCSYIDDTTAVCSVVEGYTYEFKCSATDYANNTGPWSNIVNTSVDGTGPITQFEEPSRLWINSKSFNVSWSGFDPGGSNISCYDVQWTNDSISWDWGYIQYDGSDTNCTTNTEVMFDNTTTSVTDNVTYYFQVRAWDNAGNNGTWSQVNTTVDTIPPQLDVTGIPIGDYVNITSIATDITSGVENHTIYWDTRESSDNVSCGGAAPYGGSSVCNVIPDYTIFLKYNITAIDRAENSVTQIFFFGRMVNFASNSLFLVLGSNYNMRIYVRNLDTGTDNITLKLSGTYPSGLAGFMDLRPWDFGFNITDTGRTLTVYDMEQYNETSFFVKVMSTDADEVGETLIVNATSSNSGKSETDQLLITVGYPVIFPGLNDLAVVVLIILAVLVYYRKLNSGGWTS